MDEQFVKDIVSLRGETGKKWLNDIASLITLYEKKWDISVLAPFHLTCNYVAPAIRRNGSLAVLKMRFPKDLEFPGEFRALQKFGGIGAVKLLEVDEENAAMLLERVEPGTLLTTVKDDEQMISIFASVVKMIDKPISISSSTDTIADLRKWFVHLRNVHGATSGPFPQDLFDKAESIFQEYSQSNSGQYFLHGDLHRNNILLSERGWLVIDPKGIIGEKEFETGVLLKNPYHDLPDSTTRKEKVRRRIAQLAEELDFDRDKIIKWAFAQAMLTAIWILDDYKEVSKLSIQNAELLHELM